MPVRFPGPDSRPASESETGSRRLTFSNGLTSLRLLAAPVFCWSLANDETTLAVVLFWLAVVSDLVDGRVARARGETTAFGGLLDHAADATFVSLGLAALATQGRVPLALAPLVAVAFVQYVVDSRSLAGRSLRPSSLGRLNGILYFVPIGAIVTRDALGLARPADAIAMRIGWVLVVSTVISMLSRAWALWRARKTASVDISAGP
ncbi:MAG: hypothetical protein CL908_05775 [Deltaproteobacteria bacterium]|nr:hypothetical protein [Deltaproteobacteria bacterium]